MNPLQLLEDPLRNLLEFLHENCNLTYGWAIVVLTVLVRTALLPLVIKQYSSMRAMQMVAPQLKELQRKHKGDRAKLNEELMAFYKENEINPFASCLPLAAQIPIFIALYYVLKEFAKDATVSGGSVSFMWLIDDVRVDLQDIGWGAIVLLVIYGLSQLLSTELSATPNMPASQRRLMRVLPIFVVFFVFQFPVPAGLVIYWMTTNLWTCGQQLVMRHRIGLHLADPEQIEKFNASMKRSSRTEAKGPVAALADGDAGPDAAADDMADLTAEDVAAPRSTPRRRRRRGGAKDEAEETVGTETETDAVPEPEVGPAEAEPADAPEPAEAPEPAQAPEAESAPEPEAAPSGAPANGSSGNGRSGGARRQPRPKGTAKGSRPAPSSRSKKKKR